MPKVDQEVDRVLTSLRNKIRERGFTQLEVQEALGWGRSYISQLLTKQKSLRVEQVLLILEVIDIDPRDFYAELYHLPSREADLGSPGGVVRTGLALGRRVAEQLAGELDEVKSLVRGLVRLLIDREIIDIDELTSAVKQARRDEEEDEKEAAGSQTGSES